MKLDATQLEEARRHLLGEGSDTLIRFMAGHSVHLSDTAQSAITQEQAQKSGWIDPQTQQRTTLGIFVSDSCREYLFWKERDKTLPFEGELPHLSEALFAGKYVVEIGAGMGANLMSLVGRAERICGVEPVEAYAQLGEIFSTREGLEPVEMRLGGAEELPFEDNELDLVLCVSAHQYFDIIPAFHEISRVLKPGGELVVIGGVFSSYVGKALKKIINGSESAKATAITIVNSLSYMALNRRIVLSRGSFSTSRPIYPTKKAMRRWMYQAQLIEKNPPGDVTPETCFHAQLGHR